MRKRYDHPCDTPHPRATSTRFARAATSPVNLDASRFQGMRQESACARERRPPGVIESPPDLGGDDTGMAAADQPDGAAYSSLATTNEMAKLVSGADLNDLASNSPDPMPRGRWIGVGASRNKRMRRR